VMAPTIAKMYKAEDILIVGDSFCVNRKLETDWPVHLSTKLTGEYTIPRGKGFGGCHWWSVRRCLLEEVNKAPVKVLIICHTDPHRLWSERDLALNLGTVMNDSAQLVQNSIQPYSPDITEEAIRIKEAAKAYYENLYIPAFHDWLAQRWYYELEEIIKNKQIEKVVHLRCFRNQEYIFKEGVTVKNVLNDRGLKGERNHYPAEINVKLSEEIYKIVISEVKKGLVNIDF